MQDDSKLKNQNKTKQNYLVIGIASACIFAVAGVGILSYKTTVDKNASANGIDKYKTSLASVLPPKEMEKIERFAQMSSTTPKKQIKEAKNTIKQTISSATPSFEEMKKRIDKAKAEIKTDSLAIPKLKKSLEKAIEGKYDQNKIDELKKYFDTTFGSGSLPVINSANISSLVNKVPTTIPPEPTPPTGSPAF